MNKKSILLIVIVIIVVIGGVIAFTTFNNNSQVSVGNAKFKLPSGFHEGTLNSAGDVNITNGYDTVFIKEHNESNITKCLKDYKKYKRDNNRTVKISNFTVNNTLVYKTTVKNESTIHYWFEHNGKVYSIYSWSKNNNFNDIATDLINSVN